MIGIHSSTSCLSTREETLDSKIHFVFVTERTFFSLFLSFFFFLFLSFFLSFSILVFSFTLFPLVFLSIIHCINGKKKKKREKEEKVMKNEPKEESNQNEWKRISSLSLFRFLRQCKCSHFLLFPSSSFSLF